MNKFKSNLTKNNKQIKEQRADIVCEEVKDSQENLLRNKRKTVRDLESKILRHEDFAPDSKTSLKIVSDDFNADEWVENLQNMKVELTMSKVELDIANQTYEEYFGEEE